MIQVSRNCLQSGFNVVVSRLQIVIVSSNLCSFELDWSIVVMSNLARTLATVLRLSQRDILRFDCTKNRATPTRRKVMSNKNVNDSYARGGSKFLEQQKVTTKFYNPETVLTFNGFVVLDEERNISLLVLKEPILLVFEFNV